MSFLNYFFIATFFINNNHCSFSVKKKITVILAPAGTSTNPGRIIDKVYERTITHQIATTLQTLFEEEWPECDFIIKKKTDKSSAETAQFANNKNADLVIFLNASAQTNSLPNLLLYHWPEKAFTSDTKKLSFTPFSLIHEPYAKKSKIFTELIKEKIEVLPHKNMRIHNPIALPLLMHEGVAMPAITVELGLCKCDDWSEIIDPLSNAFKALFETIKKTKETA